ncbi:MAG: hypothetical protein ABI855_02410, partial [Bacteroidota bacterium]
MVCILLFCRLNVSYSQPPPLKFFGVKPLKADTIPYKDILNEFDWQVKIISKNKIIKQYEKCKADTAFDNVEKFDTAFLYTSFKVEPYLVNKSYALEFNVAGSVRVAINEQDILKTGIYLTDEKSDLNNLRLHDLTEFILNDSVVTIEITYVPHPKIKGFGLGLQIGSLEWGKEQEKDRKIDFNKSFALGFFYLAFGIIFITLFLFYKIRNELLFFSLFCFFASISFLCTTLDPSYPGKHLDSYSLVLAIEFLSIFFAKILLNQEKTKIPLLIILIWTIVSSFPFILYIPDDFSFSFWVKKIIFLIFIIYSSFSVLYYLLQGFGQKKWEAKVITYGSLIGLFFNILLPVILRLSFSK